MIESDWHKCHGKGWGKEIVPEAYSHPAKASRNLAKRIYEHALAEGWLSEGDTVIDPFAGICGLAYHALQHGVNFMGIELERPFHDLSTGVDCTGISKADWVRFYGRADKARYLEDRHWCPRCMAQAGIILPPKSSQLGMFPDVPTASYRRNSGVIPHTEPHHYTGNLELFARHSRNGAQAVCLLGDSRKLAEVLNGAGFAGMISSPPYVESLHHTGHGIDLDKLTKPAYGPNSQAVHPAGYGRSEGQLAAMPAGDAPVACISSPPYAGSPVAKCEGDMAGKWRKTGQTPRQRSNDGKLTSEQYGDTPGNLAQLPEGDAPAACISSPPYEGSFSDTGGPKTGIDWIKAGRPDRTKPSAKRIAPGTTEGYSYGDSPNQLGQESGDTFWSAARAIVQQVYDVLAPGGHAVWILKAFVRNKAIVDFPGQWRDLCESVGFVTLHRHRAHLIEDRGTQAALIGEDDHRIRKHFSFFRRLHSQKYPHLEIKWEIVLCQQKP